MESNQISMAKITAYKLPGFCVDARGAYGVVIGDVYISCAVDNVCHGYVVTAATVDTNGDFENLLCRSVYKSEHDVVFRLRELLKNYVLRFRNR